MHVMCVFPMTFPSRAILSTTLEVGRRGGCLGPRTLHHGQFSKIQNFLIITCDTDGAIYKVNWHYIIITKAGQRMTLDFYFDITLSNVKQFNHNINFDMPVPLPNPNLRHLTFNFMYYSMLLYV